MAEENQKDRPRSGCHTDNKVQLLLQLYSDTLDKQKQDQGPQGLNHRHRPKAVRWKTDPSSDSSSYNPFLNAWSATAASESQPATPRTRAPLRKLSAKQLSHISDHIASPVFHADPSVVIKESSPGTGEHRGSPTASSSAESISKAPGPLQWFQEPPGSGSKSQESTPTHFSKPAQFEPRDHQVERENVSSASTEAKADQTMQQLDKLVHSLLGFDSATLPVIDGMEEAVQEAVAAMAGGDSRAAAEAILKGFGGIDEEE